MATEETPKQFANSVTAIERAADVLLEFTHASGELGVTDLCNRLELSKAVVHRALTSLRSRDLVQFNEATRLYSLGPASLALGTRFLASIEVHQMALVELHRLSDATHETATFSVRSGNRRVYIDQVTPKRQIISTVAIGESNPLHVGASSKALLAFLGETEIDAYLAYLDNESGEDARGFELKKELAVIRERGYAHTSEERLSGAASVAAPLLDHRGRPVACISIAGPADRLSALVEEHATTLLESTRALSTRLGYRGE